MPRLGEDEFQIVAKLSACQISGTRGEGLKSGFIFITNLHNLENVSSAN